MKNERPAPSEPNRICGSEPNSICAVTDGALLERIRGICRLRTFAAGETILEEGRESTLVGTVASGVLKMSKTMADGRQQIVGLLMPPDMFGRVYAMQGNVCIEAATEAVLCTFERKAFEQLIGEYPELEHRILVSVLDELDAAREWMLLLGCQTVQERIATFILMLARRGHTRASAPAGRYRVTVPVRRKDLAAFLGTTPETISRTIQNTARRGIIRIIDSRCFEVVQHDELVAMSGRENAAALEAGNIQQRISLRAASAVPAR